MNQFLLFLHCQEYKAIRNVTRVLSFLASVIKLTLRWEEQFRHPWKRSQPATLVWALNYMFSVLVKLKHITSQVQWSRAGKCSNFLVMHADRRQTIIPDLPGVAICRPMSRRTIRIYIRTSKSGWLFAYMSFSMHVIVLLRPCSSYNTTKGTVASKAQFMAIMPLMSSAFMGRMMWQTWHASDGQEAQQEERRCVARLHATCNQIKTHHFSPLFTLFHWSMCKSYVIMSLCISFGWKKQ